MDEEFKKAKLETLEIEKKLQAKKQEIDQLLTTFHDTKEQNIFSGWRTVFNVLGRAYVSFNTMIDKERPMIEKALSFDDDSEQ